MRWKCTLSQYLRSKCFGHEHTSLNILRIKTNSCLCPENRVKVSLKCSLPQNIGRLSSTPRAFKVMRCTQYSLPVELHLTLIYHETIKRLFCKLSKMAYHVIIYRTS